MEFETGALSYWINDDVAEHIETRVNDMLAEQDAASDADDPTDFPPSPTGQPYCACPTCMIRETIALTVQLTLEAQSAGLAELTPSSFPRLTAEELLARRRHPAGSRPRLRVVDDT